MWRCHCCLVGSALCHERANTFHFSSGNLESQHVLPPKTVSQSPGHKLLEAADTCLLPVKFLLLCMWHIKIIRCKEKGDTATLVKAFAWEGKRLEFWFCFKAAHVVLCYRFVSYSLIQAAFHPLFEAGSYARGRTHLSTHFNPILFLIIQNQCWVP